MSENKRILLVDDEEDFVKSTALRLRFEGYEVLEASDGPSAVDIAMKKKPDLILLDIMMPGLSGVEVCEKLHSDPKTSHIPIIFLTVWDRLVPESALRGVNQHKCLIKPFDFQNLIDMIKDSLKAKAKRSKVKG
ncbi:MAG: response regulator [Pseudomonadota bacterium]